MCSEVSSKIDIENNKIINIHFNSLRVSEFIQIELLLEDSSFENKKRLVNLSEKNLIIKHRIIDTQKIKIEPMPEIKRPPLKGRIIFILCSIIFGFAIVYFGKEYSDNKVDSFELNLIEIDTDSNKYFLKINPHTIKETELTNDSLNIKKYVSTDSLLNIISTSKLSVDAKSMNERRNPGGSPILLYLVFSLLPIMIMADYFTRIKYKKFIKNLS